MFTLRYKAAGKSAKTLFVRKAASSSKVLSGLASGKKVSVKVRAYKTVGGTRYYGAWSALRTTTA